VNTGHFVRSGARDNFYQTAAFIPMSFALVTTVHENGETGIGPHALCFPFSITKPYAMLLISRPTSATAANIRRTKRCALNYIEFDRERLSAVATLGYPGQAMEAKRKANPFTLVPSPTERSDQQFPLIIGEAAQVIECTWDESVDLAPRGAVEANAASRFVLRIDEILLKEQFRQGCQDGSAFPNMPIFYGFRANGEFWFAEHAQPFAVPVPRVEGTELQTVKYLADRLDEHIRFTPEACVQLAKIPRPFLSSAMQMLIEQARNRSRLEIDPAFMKEVNEARRTQDGR
jgi:flavin reductase (DIM6/NTAB) family NADH-FMN oxidoreductase RutF